MLLLIKKKLLLSTLLISLLLMFYSCDTGLLHLERPEGDLASALESTKGNIEINPETGFIP